MMKEFGLDMGAVGFAVSVDLLVRAMEGLGGKKAQPTSVYYLDGYRDEAIRLARRLRDKGVACTVSRYGGEKEGILVGGRVMDLGSGKVLEGEL
jgi:histidyl-tRNA synthetase